MTFTNSRVAVIVGCAICRVSASSRRGSTAYNFVIPLNVCSLYAHSSGMGQTS